MTLLTDAKTEVTAKLDKVKAIEKTLKEFKVEKEKQLDQKIKAESPAALPPHFATTFCVSIGICIHITFTRFIFNFSICNSFISDPRVTIFKHSPLGTSATGRCLTYHDRQPQFRQKP
jgi:hypothetical protein